MNLDEVQNQLKISKMLHEVHERNLTKTLKDGYEDANTFEDGIAYLLAVDENGNVTEIKANGSDIYSGGLWDTYKPALQ